MNILVKEKRIVAAAEKISYGIYDEDFYKWRLADSSNELLYYVIDNDFLLIEDVTLPEDYEEGKYIYENGSFEKNEDYVPYESLEEQLAKQNVRLEQLQAENTSIQMALVEVYEMLLSGM